MEVGATEVATAIETSLVEIDVLGSDEMSEGHDFDIVLEPAGGQRDGPTPYTTGAEDAVLEEMGWRE